jgi:hypothetical protein
MQLITQAGDALHNMIVEMIRLSTADSHMLVLSNEQSFFDSKELLSGRTDIFLKDLKTGKLYGCDIKTVGDYKAGMVIEQPGIEHILQCAVYLDQYNKSAELNNSKPVENWIILYLARSEHWKLKKYPHGSLFKYLWQFSIDLTKGYITVTDQFGGTKEYPEITMEKIYERYRTLLAKIKLKELPDRDYEYKYSEEKLVGMLKTEKLNKTQTSEVKKWMDKGAVEGELEMDMGDFQCRYCSWRSLCYSSDPANGKKARPILYKAPKEIVVPHAVSPKDIGHI